MAAARAGTYGRVVQTEPIDPAGVPRDVFWMTPPPSRAPGRTSFSARTYVVGEQRFGLMRVERPDGIQYARCLLNPHDEWEPHRQHWAALQPTRAGPSNYQRP